MKHHKVKINSSHASLLNLSYMHAWRTLGLRSNTCSEYITGDMIFMFCVYSTDDVVCVFLEVCLSVPVCESALM